MPLACGCFRFEDFRKRQRNEPTAAGVTMPETKIPSVHLSATALHLRWTWKQIVLGKCYADAEQQRLESCRRSSITLLASDIRTISVQKLFMDHTSPLALTISNTCRSVACAGDAAGSSSSITLSFAGQRRTPPQPTPQLLTIESSLLFCRASSQSSK